MNQVWVTLAEAMDVDGEMQLIGHMLTILYSM